MDRKKIIHLFDDRRNGGITRVLEHIKTCPKMSQDADHEIKYVSRGTTRLGGLDADIIVSHLTVSWRTLPCHVSLRALNPDTPLVHVEHTYSEGFVTHNVRRKGRFLTLLKTTYAIYDQVVAVSRTQGLWLSNSRLVNNENLSIIPSSVSYETMRKLATSNGTVKVFGTIGRLHRQKGIDTLIEAFMMVKNPDIELRLFGKGTAEAKLKRMASGDPRIKFMGYWSEPAMILSQVDVVLMPSRWEPFGLVAAQSLQGNRPTLVSDTDGLKDQVANGATIVPSPEPEAWAEAIIAMSGQPIQDVQPDPSVGRVGTPEDIFASKWRRLVSSLASCKGARTKLDRIPILS